MNTLMFVIWRILVDAGFPLIPPQPLVSTVFTVAVVRGLPGRDVMGCLSLRSATGGFTPLDIVTVGMPQVDVNLISLTGIVLI